MSLIPTKSVPNHDFAEAIERLRVGKCVAIPTETVYGLAADATNGFAVAEIFRMKGRPSFNPLLCHVCDFDMASRTGHFSQLAKMLATAFWPGPLTLVVPLKEENGIHPLVTAELPSVGIRCPKGSARDLIRHFGKPLAAPSANRSGRISPTTAAHVRSEFPNEDLLVIDEGSCDCGLESTIIKVEGAELITLRPGSVTDGMIEAATGIKPHAFSGNGIEAPGMMTSHYAPDARVRLNCEQAPSDGAWLQYGPETKESDIPNLNLSPTGSLIEAAANLYQYLKQLDQMAVDTIHVSPIPQEGVGIAINDRLRRAAAPRDAS